MALVIGNLRDAIQARPGDLLTTKVIFVPDPEYAELWEHVYAYVHHHAQPHPPLVTADQGSINPYFGYFGYQFHPILRQPHHFHLGIDFSAAVRSPITPVLTGILQYAGYHVGNGNYVMLSHPDIVSEDGFVLYTLYMHLRDTSVGFSKYQKMLREISLRTYPEIMIPQSMVIGTVGDSGEIRGMHPHVHIQCEFRHKDGTIIAIDPAPLLGLESRNNITAQCRSEEEFLKLYTADKKNICDHCVEKYWK